MSSRPTERFTCSHCSRIFERKDGLGTHFSHAHRDVNGAEDSENAEKEPVLENPGDLEIEVAESLLGVPAIPAEAMQNRQQLNIPDPLNPVSSHQESFTATTTDGTKPTNEFTEQSTLQQSLQTRMQRTKWRM